MPGRMQENKRRPGLYRRCIIFGIKKAAKSYEDFAALFKCGCEASQEFNSYWQSVLPLW